MSLGDRLREYVGRYYATYEEFGAVVGKSKQDVSNWINGDRKPASDNLMRFAAEGMNVTWLLTGEGPMRPETSEASQREREQREEMLRQLESHVTEAGEVIREMRRII